MIARLWSAETTPARAPAYAEHLRTQVLPALQAIDGYAGAMLLERALPASVELVVITWWRSLEAIRGFAGADLEHAVVAPDAKALLTRFDRRARHFMLTAEDAGPPEARR